MIISNYFFVFLRGLKNVFFLLVIFSSFCLPILSENNFKNFSDYKKNLFLCKMGGLGKDSPNKEVDNKIKQCRNALKEEKNVVGKLLLIHTISEYYGFFKSDNKLNKFFDQKVLRDRVSLYKKVLDLIDKVKEKDIDQYNQTKVLDWLENISKTDLLLLKQLTLSRLGTQYFQLREINQSIYFLSQANKLYIQGNNRSEANYFYNNGFLANIYYSKGDIQEAKNAIQKNIVNNECQIKKNCIVDKILLAEIYQDLYEYENSYKTLESVSVDDYVFDMYSDENRLCVLLSSIEDRKKYFFENRIIFSENKENQYFKKNCQDIDFSLENIAIKFLNDGKYDEAIKNFKKAKLLIKNSFGDGNLSAISRINLNIGVSYFLLNEIELSKKYFDLGFNYYQSIKESFPRYFNDLRFMYSLVLFLEPSGIDDINKGLSILDKAFRYEILFQQKVFPSMSLNQRLNLSKKNKIFDEPYNALFSLPEYLKSKGLSPIKGNQIALFTRINFQGLIEEIEKKQSILAKANPKEKKIYDQIKFLESKLSNINLNETEYKTFNNRKELLEKKLYKLLPIKPEIISSKQIADLLLPNSVFIAFQEYEPYLDFEFEEKEYIALLLFPNNKIISVNLGKSKEINQSIKQLNKRIIDGNRTLVDESLLDLNTKLLKPLNDYLVDIKTIFISPDSDINLIPLNTLKTVNGDNYFAEKYDLRLVSSAKELLRIMKKEKINNLNQSVVFSNPDFYLDEVKVVENIDLENKYLRIGNSCKTWNYLEGTIEEGNQIKKLINAKLFTDKEATVKNLKSLDSPPKILHMATHGYFCEDKQFSRHPLVKSGVVLAGANNLDNEGDDDGYLTSLEAAKLNLKNTELVVLSACNTALGDIETGNGVLGLRRALSVAGARSTLLSLWAVDDFATKAFMTSFYQKLKAGNNLRDSLIMTQQDFRNGVIKSDDPYIDWSEEFYWGAFQLSGDSSATLFN